MLAERVVFEPTCQPRTACDENYDTSLKTAMAGAAAEDVAAIVEHLSRLSGVRCARLRVRSGSANDGRVIAPAIHLEKVATRAEPRSPAAAGPVVCEFVRIKSSLACASAHSCSRSVCRMRVSSRQSRFSTSLRGWRSQERESSNLSFRTNNTRRFRRVVSCHVVKPVVKPPSRVDSSIAHRRLQP